MSKYDQLKQYRDRSPEERLAALRSEMLTPIGTIHGYSRIIKDHLDKGKIEGVPNDFNHWIDRITEASENLREILEILTVNES